MFEIFLYLCGFKKILKNNLIFNKKIFKKYLIKDLIFNNKMNNNSN